MARLLDKALTYKEMKSLRDQLDGELNRIFVSDDTEEIQLMIFKSRYLARVFCNNEGISPGDYCIVRSREITGGFEVYLRATSAIIDTYCTERRFNEEVLRHGGIRH